MPRDAELEGLARIAVDCGFHVHLELGPGLLESVYEIVLFEVLRERGLKVERQTLIPIRYRDQTFDNGFRADLLIEDRIIVELKSTQSHAAVHTKQLLTYLRLAGLPLGFVMNFGMATFKEGVHRLGNDYFAPRH